MNQNFDFEDVTSMEEEAKYKIITMEDEEDDPRASQILKEIMQRINESYEEFRIWMKDYQEREEVVKRKQQLKEDNDRLIAYAKLQITKLKENDELKQAVDKGLQVASDAGNWIIDTISVGVKEVMRQEPVQKFSANVNEKIVQIKEDERVKDGIQSLKQGTLKVAESAFEGLKKVLDTDKTSESETEVFENEKNHNL